jgi:hypothetical protein
VSVAERDIIGAIRAREDKGPFEIRATQLAAEFNVEYDIAESALNSLAERDELKRLVHIVCPCDRSERLDFISDPVCSACGRAFGTDVEGHPATHAYYRYDAPQSRDVRWMIALHGMNTAGPWQEEFMWHVSRAYGYAIPVAIYKYGIVRPGVILKFRQRTLMNRLIARMRTLSKEAERSGCPGPPDIIAHSFGTWLLGHALESDESIRVGRVVLLGCILRPDFNWRELIARGRVEAVLCHHSAKDCWARVAQYVIPDSGPSGRIGFNDHKGVVNHGTKDLGHSDYFLSAQMPQLFQSLWEPFLTRAPQRIFDLSDGDQSPGWSQSAWITRATVLRIVLLGVIIFLIVFVVFSLLVGAHELVTRYMFTGLF